jgi:hypothetical protein
MPRETGRVQSVHCAQGFTGADEEAICRDYLARKARELHPGAGPRAISDNERRFAK